MSTSSTSAPSEWRWLWREVQPFWRYQLGALGCIVASTTLTTTVPLLMKWVIDDILPRERWRALTVAALLIFLTFAARVLFAAASALINSLGVQRMILRVRLRLIASLQRLPAAFYLQHSTGDLMQRVERDVAVVGELGSDIMPPLLRIVLQTVTTVIAMLLLDWRLGAIIALMMPLMAIVQQRYRDILRRNAEQLREASGEQSGELNELLTGAVQAQVLGAEPRLARRYARLGLVTMQRQFEQRRHEAIYTSLEMSALALGMGLVVGYGGALVITGSLTPGGLVAFYAYIGTIFAPMEAAAHLYARLQRVRASVRRLMAIDDEPARIREPPDAAVLPHPPRTLTYRDVSFQYTADRPTLRQVQFDVRAGERVTIVGASGSGKSSLLQMIPRLYDVTGGQIAIDGHDLRRLSLRDWRRAISFVPQSPVLFTGTIRDNLRHGSPTSTDDEIAEAAWIACFAEVIDRLPQGWGTELGPAGSGLSGGEQQRLAIARALLQRRSVLILDEPTSALDLPTERTLLTRLAGWCDGRIVIAASHRLAMARWADRVIVMTAGTITEDGPPQLLHHPGTDYYALWQRHGVSNE